MFAEDGMFRKIVKWSSISLGVLLALLVVAVLALLSPGLYNRFSYFPKEKAAWQQLAKTRVEVNAGTGWNEYKGSIHSHSELSHDSKAPLPDIQKALKSIGSNFIMMSDHYVNGKADYSLGWKGDHDGVLFVRGFEMDHGIMPWGLPDSTVFDAKDDVRTEAKKIKELGGIVAYAHCEQEDNMDWAIPELEAMEIYNIHATMLKHKTEKMVLWKTLATVLTCYDGYVLLHPVRAARPGAAQVGRLERLPAHVGFCGERHAPERGTQGHVPGQRELFAERHGAHL
jgi:hypothetical protein